MIHPNSKTLIGVLTVLALFLGAGWIAPQSAAGTYRSNQAGATETMTVTAEPSEAATGTESPTAETTVSATAAATGAATAAATGTSVASPTAPARGTAQQLMDYVASFSLDPSTVTPSNVSASDRSFLDVALAQNTAGLEMMQLATRHISDSNIRGLVKMMQQMHEKDQALLVQLEKQVGGNEKPASLSRVQILPDSPEGKLGFQWVDLNVVFIDKVKNSSGSAFGLVFLNEMVDLHTMGIETALTTQANTANPSIQALAGHLAQEESLHVMLMTTLRNRLYFHQDTPIYFPVPPNTGSPTAVPSPSPVGTGTAEPAPTETTTGTAEPAPTETTTLTPGPGETTTPTVETTSTQVPTTAPTNSYP